MCRWLKTSALSFCGGLGAADRQSSIGYFTTGPDDFFTIPYADSGTYIFKEYHTLAGYELNREPIVIKHTTDGNVDIVVDNVEYKNLIVHKIDSNTKKNDRRHHVFHLAGWRSARRLCDG